ncbi:MAG: hypothetical protein IJ365_06700 [Clostridia bacterium]|nr:hypothetical protein [Clostridia bacterium]
MFKQKPNIIGTMTPPAEPTIEVSVSETCAYAYTVRNIETVDKKPNIAAYMRVVGVMLTVHLFAINKMMHATTADTKFACSKFDIVNFMFN